MKHSALPPNGFRHVPKTGVIYVMTEAEKQGYTPSDSGWANLGQGSPEVGQLADGPARISQLNVQDVDLVENKFVFVDKIV